MRSDGREPGSVVSRMVATRWKGLLPGSVICDCWKAFSATSETRTPSSAAELQAARAKTVIAIRSFISILPEDEIREISRCRVVYTTVRMGGCGSAVFMPGVVASKLVLTIRKAENSGARVRRVLRGGGLLSGVTEGRNKEGDVTSNPAVDTAVRSKGFVTDNVPWIGEYPME